MNDWRVAILSISIAVISELLLEKFWSKWRARHAKEEHDKDN